MTIFSDKPHIQDNETDLAGTLLYTEPGIAKDKKEEISMGVQGHAPLEKI